MAELWPLLPVSRLTPKTSCPASGLNGWGLLLDRALQPIGRWQLSLSPLGGGAIVYTLGSM